MMGNTTFKELNRTRRLQGLSDVARGMRLPSFIGLAVDPDQALGRLRLCVVGVGSIGRNVAEKAARLSIGAIYLIDPGRFKAASMLTHPIEPHEATNQSPKARSTGRLCRRISPSTRVYCCDGYVEDLDRSDLANVDLVIMATDNLAAEVNVAQRCIHLRKPLIHAAVYGEALIAQIRFYANADGQGTCVRCGYGEAEVQFLNNSTRFSCTGPSGEKQAPRPTGQPTMSTAFLCSLAADLAMDWVVRYALRLGAPLTDGQLEFSGFTGQTTLSPLPPRAPDCPCDHTPWDLLACDRPLGRMTLRDLAAVLGIEISGHACEVSFRVGRTPFVEVGICPQCGQVPVEKFIDPGQSVPCNNCNADVWPDPYHSHDPVQAIRLRHVLDRPLRRISTARVRSVLVRDNHRTVLIYNPVREMRDEKGSVP